ncbi:MAG: 3-oxoacyl-ACP synthase, partial [Micrococcales bacterium]|nr:3-oxoacyl-ACP synthase [Micrococcales bacterium]
MLSPVAPKGTGAITIPEAVQHSGVLGVGAYRPERVVTNAELVDKIDSSDEWIRERSGIISRHRAAPEESVIDMAEAAARQAMEHAGITADQLGFILLATVTHPYQTPAAAPELAHRLGSSAPAMDISAACAGYCFGIGLASDMVRSGSVDHVLVIGVEKLSDFTDEYDRGTAFIFGDGAGAAVVGRSDIPGIGRTVWGSEGDKHETISQQPPWTDLRDSSTPGEQDPSVWPTIGMAGQAVFRWAVWGMAPVAPRPRGPGGRTQEDRGPGIPPQA